MSDRTPSAASVNPIPATPNPEPQLEAQAAPAAPAEQPAPSPEVTAPAPVPAVQESAEQAAEQAAEHEQEAREQADATRAAAVKAYRKGESAYAAGLLESGRLCGVYVGQRLALGDKREVAVKALEGDLSRYSSTEVDVNRLIRTYHAYRLLALETGLTEKPAKGKPAPAESVAYGVYRDAWCRLVERVASGREESYVLLPDCEKACQSMFRRAVRDELSAKASGELVAKLVRAYSGKAARLEKAKAAQAKVKAAEAEAARQKAVADMRAAEAVKAKAAEAAKGKSDAATAADLAAAAADLEAKQRAVIEQQAKAEAAERDRKRAEKLAKEQADRDAKAAEKAARKTEAAQQPAKVAAGSPAVASTREQESRGGQTAAGEQKGTVSGNLLRIAEVGNPKDVAGMIVDLLTGAKKPAEVLRIVAASLRWSRALAVQLVEGLADNTVDPGKAEAALEAMAAKAAEYVGEGFGEEVAEEQPAGPSPGETAKAQASNGQAVTA